VISGNRDNAHIGGMMICQDASDPFLTNLKSDIPNIGLATHTDDWCCDGNGDLKAGGVPIFQEAISRSVFFCLIQKIIASGTYHLMHRLMAWPLVKCRFTRRPGVTPLQNTMISRGALGSCGEGS